MAERAGSEQRPPRRAAAVAATALGVAWTVLVDLPAFVAGEWAVLASTLPGTAFVVAGGVATTRRPDHPAGRVLALVGWLWPLARVQHLGGAVAGTISLALYWWWVVPLIYLVLTFPGRRPSGRLDVVLVAIAAFDAVVVQVAWLTVLGDARVCATCEPRNALDLFDNDAVLAALDLTSFVIAIAILFAVIVRVRRRWTGATVPARRALAPVIVTGGAALSMLMLTFAVMMLWPDQVSWRGAGLRLTALLVATVPFGFLLGLLRARARRARVGELVVELGELPRPAAFQTALRKALGDPALVAAWWSPGSRCYVDPDGRALDLPADGEASTTTFLDHGAEPLAVIVHDRALLDDPGLLAATTAAARLAIENERLQREVVAQLAEVHASRARIVEAGDEARRRIERDLHDGAQQRLVSLSIQLKLLHSLVANEGDGAARVALVSAAQELAGALADLRALASGIHPMILSQDGLAAAVESVAERSRLRVEIEDLPTRRLPAAVETASYYVVCEALTNAAKHAHPSRVRVAVSDRTDSVRITVADDGIGGARLSGGTGLRGIADRVHALDGTFDVHSPVGGGTTLVAELPVRAVTEPEVAASRG